MTEACARHILDSIPTSANPTLGFSEYHLYYTWVSTRHPENVFLDHNKKLTRTGKQVWTTSSCSTALSLKYASDVFMVVLEQSADYSRKALEPPGLISKQVQEWHDVVPYPSTRSKDCRWVKFQESHQTCVHEHDDTISDTIELTGRWADCDILDKLWNSRPSPSADDIYVEIGGNIGSCVFHMLLHTDAHIKVFEPNPDNLFCLTSTLLQLSKETQNRVTLYPIALGLHKSTSKLYVSSKNAGNGVLNQKIGRSHEKFNQPIDIEVRRYDELLTKHDSVGLLKMDAQGHECAIVRGMGRLVEHIKVIKTEIANLWLSGHQNCSDSILFNLLQTHGRRIEDEHGVVLTEPKVLDVYDTSTLHTRDTYRCLKEHTYEYSTSLAQIVVRLSKYACVP